MLEKIRNNIALVIGGFTIVGGIVGGINTVGRLVDTLSGIDDRVSQLEELVADNEINNQISIITFTIITQLSIFQSSKKYFFKVNENF